MRRPRSSARLALPAYLALAGCGSAPAADDAASADAAPLDAVVGRDADRGDAPSSRDARAAADALSPLDARVALDGAALDAPFDPDAAPFDAPPLTDAPARPDECALTGYPPLTLVPLVPGYLWDRPVLVTHAPGSADTFVVDARGYVLVVRDGAVLPTPFLDATALIGTLGAWGDERGLLGLAFHPDYGTNGRFFVGVTPVGGDNLVMEGRRSATDPDRAELTLRELLRAADFETNHNGGMVAFGPDGLLYAGIGDGGGAGDPRQTAQDPSVLLGKMLRIDVDATSPGLPYAIPLDNPFVGVPGVRAEIWALGYRNPWRFSFDPTSGVMFVGEVGQGEWEELDIEPAGAGGRNYGWSELEGTRTFAAGRLRSGDTPTPPALEIPHLTATAVLRDACSITGGYVYRGAAIPGLRGGYVFGDYCSRDLAALRFCDGAVRDLSRLDLGGPVGGPLAFGEGPDGELHVIAFQGAGLQVLRVVAR